MTNARRPLFFGPDEARLFGFYDPPAGHRIREAAVVLCPPFGEEYIRAHRALVQMARQLSDAGFPVLRFDYSGCGDSWGEAADGGLAQWVEDTRLAIDEARSLSGCSRVRLVGLRLGAAVAALAARGRPDIEAIALWAPVADGPRYVEELERVQAEFLRFAYVTVSGAGRSSGSGATEILGFPFPARLRAELQELALFPQGDIGPPRILVFDPEAGPGAEELAARLREGGREGGRDGGPAGGSGGGQGGAATVMADPNPGKRPWLTTPDQALVPVEALAAIVKWLSADGDQDPSGGI